MNNIEVGELLYKIKLNVTGITEYGVSFTALVGGEIAPPAEGARFDAAFDGEVTGPKLNGTVKGIDYLRLRADGRFELNIHETITTADGENIDAQGVGISVLRPESSIADIRVTMTLHNSSDQYKWVNALHAWGIGTLDLEKQTVEVTVYSA